MSGGGGGSSTEYDWTADEMYREVSRAQWEDYKSRFSPWEDTLIAQTGGSTEQEAVDFATSSVDNAFKSQKNAMDMDTSRYGVQQTAAQKESMDRGFGLQKAASMANAKNTARDHVKDRDMAIMSGGMDMLGKQTGRIS